MATKQGGHRREDPMTAVAAVRVRGRTRQVVAAVLSRRNRALRYGDDLVSSASTFQYQILSSSSFSPFASPPQKKKILSIVSVRTLHARANLLLQLIAI
jgi:hypothetical protein